MASADRPSASSAAQKAWVIALTSSRASPVPIGYGLRFTATVARDIAGSGYVLQVFDITAGRVICRVTTGYSCTTKPQRYTTVQARQYVGRLMGAGATSPQLTATWVNDWVVTLEASSNSSLLGAPVTLIARANHKVTSTPFALVIRDLADSRLVCTTRSGSACRTSAETYANAVTHTYVAQLESPVVAQSHSSAVTWEPTVYVSGATPSSGLLGGISPAAAYVADHSGPLPTAIDLSAWAPTVGNQGTINSCTSWAVGYYYRAWLRSHAGLPSTNFAPMYLYSQIAHGRDGGSSFASNLAILTNQGVDTRADYWQGTNDYTTQPTAPEVQNALRFPIAQPGLLFSGAGLDGTTNVIKAEIAAGDPVLVNIPVYSNFDTASASNPLIGLPPANESPNGTHALFAPKYDDAGLWVENSWGTAWGGGGWAELSWPFVAQYALEGFIITGHDNEFSPDFFDDFSGASLDTTPSNWELRGTQGMTPNVVDVGLPSPAHQALHFPSVGGELWDKWALVDRLVAAPPYTITAKILFNQGVADRAGITFGWNDSTWDRVDIQPNVYWDDIEFRTGPNIGLDYVVSGSAKNPGGLTITPNTPYWLRAAVSVANNIGTVTISWSTDGVHFNTVMSASGASLSNAVLTGGVGVGTAGPNMPDTDFDDFSVQGV